MCPHGRRLLAGKGGIFEPAEIVCHCLVIEADDGLVLVDTGFGVADTLDLGRLGGAYKLMRPRGDLAETALKQLEALGFAAGDVRRIVATHLDPDHSGGRCASAPATAASIGTTDRTGSGTRSRGTSGSGSRASASCRGAAPRCSSCRSRAI